MAAACLFVVLFSGLMMGKSPISKCEADLWCTYRLSGLKSSLLPVFNWNRKSSGCLISLQSNAESPVHRCKCNKCTAARIQRSDVNPTSVIQYRVFTATFLSLIRQTQIYHWVYVCSVNVQQSSASEKQNGCLKLRWNIRAVILGAGRIDECGNLTHRCQNTQSV